MKLIDRGQIAGMNCHYYNYSLDYFFDSLQMYGYTAAALWGGAPHFYLDYLTYSDCREIRRKAQKRGIAVKCFTPSSGTYGYQMGMQPPSHRERVYQYYCRGIQAAAELGCRQMSMNSGWGYWNEPFGDAWARSKEMIARLCLVAEKEGVVLTMESLRRAESQLAYNLENTKRLYDEIRHPFLKIMVDTTAMGVAGEELQDWFCTFSEDIVNTHFIDGTPYGHLVWGDGRAPLADWLKTLTANGYRGLLGLEITARRYYADPRDADRRNMEALLPFLE